MARIAIGLPPPHAFRPGGSGAGRTTLVMRLADAALANGHSVLILDCKGAGSAARPPSRTEDT
jgi:Mrp family chromosome partitioning ATPase